jgi:hypothetical protein
MSVNQLRNIFANTVVCKYFVEICKYSSKQKYCVCEYDVPKNQILYMKI